MPGYEVYNSSGSLAVRVRRGDDTAISEEELEELGKSTLPKETSFFLKFLNNEEFEKSVLDQAQLKTFPRFDGSRETVEARQSNLEGFK